MARLIEVKADIVVELPNEDKTITMKDFLVEMVEIYKPLGANVKTLRQANKIIDAIEKGNGTIRLEDADFEIVKKALHVDDSGGDYTPMVARHLIPFIDAVENAQEIKV